MAQFNKDNSRLVSELSAARKAAYDLESKLNNNDAKLQDAGARMQAQVAKLTQY